MAQVTNDMPHSQPAQPAFNSAGVLPWPVLAVMAGFVLGIEGGLIYLFLQIREGRNISEFVGFFAGMGALVWPIIGLVYIMRLVTATRIR